MRIGHVYSTACMHAARTEPPEAEVSVPAEISRMSISAIVRIRYLGLNHQQVKVRTRQLLLVCMVSDFSHATSQL